MMLRSVLTLWVGLGFLSSAALASQQEVDKASQLIEQGQFKEA